MKIHKCTVAFEFICCSLVLATSKQILGFAGRYSSVCLKGLFTCTFNSEIHMHMLADVRVCAHEFVNSCTLIKHSPTKYRYIYIQMGKAPIFFIEIL